MAHVNQPTGSDDPRVGGRLGKYQVTQKLGRGGMGVVYEAEDTVLKRRVAIKLLSDDSGADSEPLRRLLHEAQAAARLNHPNVVTVHEVNRRDGVHYIAMELVDGGSAQDFLETMGPFNWLEATRVIADACRGLVAAHAAGLIHRDIKPANIMRSGDGIVKLADFGLAKITDRPGVSISGPGTLVGTPHYMSPEQCRFDPIDDLSDIYSLGATYFALLTGRPPYPGDLPVQVMYAHCSNPVPDPRELDARIPDRIAAIARKAMAKWPEDRFGSAAEMLASLEAALRAAPKSRQPPAQWSQALRAKHSPGGRPVRRMSALFKRPLLSSAVAACILVIVAALTANFVLRTPKSRDTGPLRPNQLWQLATREGFEIELDAPVVSVAITPDGRYVAVRECDARSGTVRAWDLFGPGPDKPLLRAGDVRLGRGPFPLAEAWKREGRLLAFSPDGGTIVTGSIGGQKDAAGLSSWPVADLPQRFAAPAERWGDVHALAFSSTGLLATTVRLDPLDKNGPDLYVWDLEADAMIARTRAHANMISSLAFSADGTRLASCAYKGPIKFFFPHRDRNSLENKRIAPDKNVKATGLAFAPTGNLLATVAENQLTIWDSDSWQPVQSATLDESTAGVSDIELFSVAYSPDGRLIAAAGGSGPRGYVVIWKTEPAANAQPIAILRGHRGPVTAVAFSALQPILVSGSTDGTIRLWDMSGIE